MKARHFCAVLGVAVAVGTVTFMQSLVATNDRQAQAVAERLLKTVPVAADARVARMSLDYRPGGRVMQGPPMMVAMTTDKTLPSAADSCVVTKALFAQRRLPVPPIGTELTFVGRRGAYRLKLAAVLDWDRPLRGYPNVFVSPDAVEAVTEDWMPWEPRTVADLAPGFMSDAGRNLDRSKALLLWAAALTALCLLVNSLFLSIEARRKEIAVLRMVGMTRGGVVGRVALESCVLASVGFVLGTLGALALLKGYVACDGETFPMGMAFAAKANLICLVATPVVALAAALVALKPALSVRPLEAASNRAPRKRHFGMLIAFAFGFGAFVAVEVWGASLMSAFVPSRELPDAIVSILPGGVSSFDIEKLQGKIKGVRRIHELAPLQVNFDPLEEMTGFKSQRPGGGKSYRNVLLLGSDWLPELKFVAGDRASAVKAIAEGDSCVITEMMARARRLKLGDELKLDAGRELKIALRIVGIVDCKWHMVTSRALVRGLNRMPSNTDGPAFVSFNTVEACDPRPAMMVNMTHVWLDYEPDFLAAHGVFEAGRLVEREIVEALGGAYRMDDEEQVFGNTVRLHARDEIADGTLAHGNDIIGSMARVPFIFIAVISLGFIAMLVADADSRRREFTVLRAVGATRLQLAAVLTREAMKIALWGVALGFPGGALVGWLFTSGTRAAMANWGIPPNFAIPGLVIAEGALGAIVFALAVAVPTSLLLLRRASNAVLMKRKELSMRMREVVSLIALMAAGTGFAAPLGTPDESSLSIGSAEVAAAKGAVGAFALPLRVERIPILPDEYWWGGVVMEGMRQPFSAASEGYRVDMRYRHGPSGGNQAAPVLLSSKGRWVWCEQAFRFSVTKGQLVIESEKAAPILSGAEPGGTLRDAYLHCSKAFFPPKGTPKLRFFERPILNTWIELKYEQNEKDILAYGKSFVDNGIPPGVYMIDHTWHREPFGCWDFLDGRFRDPKGMVKKLNAMGYTMMLWFDPHISTCTAVYRQLRKEGLLLKGPGANGVAESEWWPGKGAILDCTNPKAYAWLKATLDRLMDDYGVEGFFFDAGDAYNYPPSATPFVKDASPSDQVRAFHLIGMDVPYQQHRAAWKMGGLPLMQTLRDKHPTWEEVHECIVDGLLCSLIGYPFVVFDLVGGGTVSNFEGENFKAAQTHYIRSLQTQCLSPMIQFSLSPWRVLDARHQQIVRDQIALRQKWAPYIVQCAVDCGRTGEPMMRSMEYAYPGHGWEKVDDQFLMGEKLLVAPQVYGKEERTVVIPPGTWTADDGTTVVGPRTITVKTPLERLPHFTRF